MTTRSLIIEPASGSALQSDIQVNILGLAFSRGYSIKDVIVSVDGGKNWGEARLGKDMGRYSWIQWSYPWKPERRGKYILMSVAAI
jgi:hypothetical protein